MIKKYLLAFILTLMSTTAFGLECLDMSPGDYGDNTGAKQSQIESAYKKQEDSKTDLQACFMDGLMRGKHMALTSCPCKDAVKKHCSWRKGKIRASGGADKAWCVFFLL